ncbi:hypothetical protein A2U01_0075469 [Trifolium medium]|uniref:Uncharacterized protein n=1 Tax=Trifolium medium TaxID=97028 RepID=A0A392T241_9FABA|nr:hypothetical protein [Trifolium medium]
MLQKLATDRDLFLYVDGGCNNATMSIKDTGNMHISIQVSDVTKLALALFNDAGGRIIKDIDG